MLAELQQIEIWSHNSQDQAMMQFLLDPFGLLLMHQTSAFGDSQNHQFANHILYSHDDDLKKTYEVKVP